MARHFRVCIVIIGASLGTLSHASAQFCATVTDSAFLAPFASLLASRGVPVAAVADDTTLLTVPVAFHVETESGARAVDDARIAAALASVNAWYETGEIRFEQCGETLLFTQGTSSPAKRRVLNVYVVRAADGCGSYSGTIWININCSRSFENILSHELGHALGLPHTHGHTNMGTTNELVDGSNCATAGDGFCDTPADPNLLGKVDGACKYVGTARDANGMAYAPRTDNIMSYSNSSCMTMFSAEQFGTARRVARSLALECCLLAPPLTRDSSVCRGQSLTLVASAPGGELRWYDTPSGGVPLGTGPAFITPPLYSPAAWYVEAWDGCSSERSRIFVNVLASSGVIAEYPLLVSERVPGPQSAELGGLTPGDTALYLTQHTGNGASILRISAGTPSYASIWKSPAEQISISRLAIWNSMLFWGTNDRKSGPSLYRYNPADDRTDLLLHVPDSTGSQAFSNFWLTPVDGYVLFMLNDGAGYTQLWRSEGSAADTKKIIDLPGTGAFNDFSFTTQGSRTFFIATDSTCGSELWVTDGSAAGTRMIADIAPGNAGAAPRDLTPYDGRLYFTADDGVTGRELWSSDGTAAGTTQVLDLHPSGSAEIGYLAVLGGKLCFFGSDGVSGIGPYETDGTAFGTRRLASLSRPAYNMRWFGESGGRRIFIVSEQGTGDGLWRLDPTAPEGASFLAHTNPGGFSMIPEAPTPMSGRLVFPASNTASGTELWACDGSVGGTFLLADVDTALSSNPRELTLVGRDLFFLATTRPTGTELYRLVSPHYSVCNGESMIIRTGGPPIAHNWYDVAEGGVPIAQSMKFSTPPLRQSKTYYAEDRIGACLSARTAFRVHVLAPDPVARDTAVPKGSPLLLSAFAESGQILWYSADDTTRVIAVGPSMYFQELLFDKDLYVQTVEESCRSGFILVRVRVVGTSDTESPPASPRLQVYPNPASMEVRVSLAPGSSRRISLYSLLGVRVLEREVREDEDGITIRTDALAPGMYIVDAGRTGKSLLVIRR